MIDTLATIIFLGGLMILIFVHVKMLHSKQKFSHRHKITMTIWIVVSIIILGVAWILREFKHNEKYGYNYAYQSGKIVGGTVYTKYPDKTGGLGWVL
jgi:NADH:ubiquinone oxidoreductase subunit 6 (subunit J)